MKILTGKDIREVDKATIEREGISSLDLVERAARGIARWIEESIAPDARLLFCCGKGGNGNDGLASARILAESGRECTIFMAVAIGELTADALANLSRLPKGVEVYDITVERPDIEPDAVIIDALLGVGMTGPVREPIRGVIEWLNSMRNRVISIDIPSGMRTEWGSSETGIEPDPESLPGSKLEFASEPEPGTQAIVCADTTLTIGFPKLSLLQPETGAYAGEIVVLPIGLDEKFIAEADTPYYYITEEWAESLREPRAKFSHKGDYGHALLVCGSETMPGAAILAAGGALRSGCGLVTAHIPKAERFALAANHPSAMLSLDAAECFSMLPDNLDRFSAIGVGSGLGRDAQTVEALEKLLKRASVTDPSPANLTYTTIPSRKIPMVLDADALNIIAENPDFKQFIPEGSVLTPHSGELRRLVGGWRGDREKLEKASCLAAEISSVVIVKGAHSVICTPDGRFVFNSTGTTGMAKGGSGDVLTGLLTGLLARGYDMETASIIGVYNHGRAGESAAELYGVESMNASDLSELINLG